MITIRRKSVFSAVLLLLILLIVQCLCAFSLGAAEDGSPETGSYIAKSWSAESGLPHSSVRALVQTGDGYLWLGTAAGLVRFDGIRFTVYSHLNTPPLGNSRILALYEDAGGVLWIGTDGGGLYAYEAGEWRNFGKTEGFLNNHVRAVAGDGRGNLWIGTEFGLHKMVGEGIRSYGLKEGLADNLITALAADGRGRLWAGTMRGGLMRFEDGLVQMYDFDDGLRDLTVLSLTADPGGAIWIGTMNGLFVLQPVDGRVRPVPHAMSYPVTSIVSDSSGVLLIGTMTEGIKILDGVFPYDLLPGERLASSHVHAILPFGDGLIWVGTESDGLIRIKERSVGSIAALEEGRPLGSVYALLEDDDGTLWVGTESSGLYRMRVDWMNGERAGGERSGGEWPRDGRSRDKRLSDERTSGTGAKAGDARSGRPRSSRMLTGRIIELLDRSQGLAGDMVRSLLRDGSGNLWVGTADGGLSIIHGDRITNLTTADGLVSNNVTAMLLDDEGTVWIGTDRGLDRCVGGAIEIDTAARTLVGRVIRTLARGERGVLYVCTRNGVWRRSDSSFERIGAAGRATEIDVLSLCEDGGGGLWVGTNGNGLRHLHGKGSAAYTTRDGLPGNFIYSITVADTGLLWMSSENGVFSISRDSLIAYAENAACILTPTLYDDSDGMPSGRCSGFCSPAFCESHLGVSLYPTEGGIAVFDRHGGRAPSEPPVVRIESILADEVPFDEKDLARLSHRTSRLEVRFTVFDYAAPEKCRIVYRLAGYDSVFTALHPRGGRSVVYRDPPPGEYEFTIRAVGNGGLWSRSAATARFVVLSPFYRKRAFPYIVVALVVLVVGAVESARRYRNYKRLKMKYSTVAMDGERMEKALAELHTLMEEEKAYLDPDLTLKKLAQRLKIHNNHLSRIINERFEMSFNNYVNRYRIEEAKERLADPAERNRNILEIMYDVGFYSKSTFNTAFKKFTGMSPSEYRRKHR
jgi:ligand-binding sensor domain-containing protein/AraC-like DNA-binding protein